VKDYQLLIERISRILKPGALVELAEFDFTIYNRFRQRIKVDLDAPVGPPYWSRFMAHMNRAVKSSGGDTDAASHLWKWVTTHGAFENITYRDVWIPTIPGNDEMYAEHVYSMIRDDISVSTLSVLFRLHLNLKTLGVLAIREAAAIGAWCVGARTGYYRAVLPS
jgi:hypothetical protein